MSQAVDTSPETIYLAAVAAAGPAADDIPAFRSRVDALADTLLAGLKDFNRKIVRIASSITLVGVVVSVEANPRSEQGRQLNLAKVVFRADAGTRTDQMWLDKTDAADMASLEVAQALVGKRARIVKVQKTQFLGDEPRRDNEGKVITSPYLGSIEPLDAATAPTDEVRTEAQPELPAQPEAPSTPGGRLSQRELLALNPKSATAVVTLAGEHFGLSAAEVKQEVENAIGPKQQGKSRTASEIARAWSAIVRAHAGAAASAAA